jgi:hypothetical protein
MHVHVSAISVDFQDIKIGDKTENKRVEMPIALPIHVLVYLFDHHIFNALCVAGDDNIDVGRYRSKGFYETKSREGHHFEYRSLGSSAFTPARVKIIFDMVKEIMDNIDFYAIQVMCNTGKTSQRLAKLYDQLKDTKQATEDLRKLWVPWE